MSYLIFNGGSFSLKWGLYDEELNEIDRGYQKDYDIEKILSKYKDKVKIIGHRVVHGGWNYFAPTKIDKKVLAYLKTVSNLAPLHNPYEIKIIERCFDFDNNISNFAVFDTEFFCSLPDVSRIYGVNKELSDKHKLRRFGFHGISHQFVAEKAADKLGDELASVNLITIHLGAGCSIVAIKRGKAVDCSFGFTPTEGLLMAKRCGDIDPGIIFYLINQKGMCPRDLEKTLIHNSGLLGLTGSDDIRDVINQTGGKDDKALCARLALDIFCYRIRKYIGAYFAIIGGKLDGVVFTGEIGYKSDYIRSLITKGMDKILADTAILAIKTNEELAIAGKLSKL